MGLLEIGYHYLILPNGKLVGLRPIDTIGAHCAGFNHTHIGVCLAGGHWDHCPACSGDCGSANPPVILCPMKEPISNFTAPQGETLRGLMDYIHIGYPGIPLEGHTERRPRHPHQCPPMDMDEVRSWIT